MGLVSGIVPLDGGGLRSTGALESSGDLAKMVAAMYLVKAAPLLRGQRA